MLGLPVDAVNEWANRAYIVAGVIAIFATAIALIASFFIWRTGAALSQISDEKIALANETAGRANERAASLERDASEARVEQERLRVRSLELEREIIRIGPRQISAENRARFQTAATAENYKPMVVVDMSTDPESANYVGDVLSLLQSSGFTIAVRNRIMVGLEPGVCLSDRTGVLARLLTGINVRFRALPSNPGDPDVVLSIGQKTVE